MDDIILNFFMIVLSHITYIYFVMLFCYFKLCPI